MGESVFLWSTLRNVFIHKKNNIFSLIDGVLFDKNTIHHTVPCSKSTFEAPEGIINIEKYCFKNNYHIKCFKFPSTIQNIGNGAFQNSSLEIVYFSPSSLQYISTEAFQHSNITFLDLSNSTQLHTIGSNAFKECYRLTTIIVNSAIRVLDTCCFSDCYKLKYIQGNLENLQKIGLKCFAYTSLSSFQVPKSLESIGFDVFIGYRIQYYSAPNNSIFFDMGDVLFTLAGEVLVMYPTGKNSSQYKIPDGVSSIRSYAFRGAKSLQSVIFPSSLTSILWYAFADTGIKFIKCTGRLSIISEGAFWNCTELVFVNITGTLDIVSKLCFGKCTALKTICLPKTIRRIQKNAFYGCLSLRCIMCNSSNRKLFIDTPLIRNIRQHCPNIINYLPNSSVFKSNLEVI